MVRVLGDVLEERLAEARALDADFAADLAGTLADFALSGGSRRRAVLVWWGWRACGGGTDLDGDRPERDAVSEPGVVLRIAAALELVQCCALVHDDVMDGSTIRRGRPAVHVGLAGRHGREGVRAPGGPAPFGWSSAVLVGDLALAWADDLVAETVLPDPVRGGVQSLWRAMRTEMVAGQYLDLLAHSRAAGQDDRTQRTAMLKSGLYSVERPLLLGATLAGAAPAARLALKLAGADAGLAFQLRDDLLGLFGDPAVTGKPAGDDIRAGKATHLVAVARERAHRRGDRAALRVLDDALGDRTLSPAGLEQVREAVVRLGARRAVEQRIAELVSGCARTLQSAPLDPVARDHLLTVLQAAAGERTPEKETP